MSAYRTALLLLMAAAMSGCHSFGPLVKRDSEENCPTDIRKTVPWCAGEDAIFQCPCGPSEDYYGHKPTCWRTWPGPTTVWRDSYCAGACQCPLGPNANDSNELLILPPTEEGSLEPVQAPAADSAAPATIEPLPPTSRTSTPRNKKETRTLRRQVSTQQVLPVVSPHHKELSRAVRPQPVAAAPADVRRAAFSSDQNNSLAGAPISQANYAEPLVGAPPEGSSEASSTLSVVTLPPVADQTVEQRPKRPRRAFPWLHATSRAASASESSPSQNSEFVR
jgi:hypothetical protein